MKIELHFVTTKSWVSRIIRWATFSPFSHVEFCINENTPMDLAKGRRGYLGALGHGGVKIRNSDYDAWCGEIFLETEDLPEPVARAIWEFAFAQIDKPYDWSALIGMGLNRDWHQPDKWFCSELVEAAFDAGGHKLLNDWGKANRITPGMLVNSPRLYTLAGATSLARQTRAR